MKYVVSGEGRMERCERKMEEREAQKTKKAVEDKARNICKLPGSFQ